MGNSDVEIIKQCQEGNKEKFGELYERYVEKIYQFLYYRTFSRETAEDLVSQTFFKALRNLEKFQGENFSAWLYRIARNNLIDHYRTDKHNLSLETIWDLKEEKDWEIALDNKQKLEEVKKLLQKFSPEQQEIILLRVWDDLPYKEIAKILEKSEASCKMMFSRAIKELKGQMPVLIILLLSLNTAC